MDYLLSVVIPTKNRYDALTEVIKALLPMADHNPELEIVIQDNSDDNKDFLAFFSGLNRKNIVYDHVAQWLSVGDNCDRAILNSHGKYVCFIGDDDAVAPQIVEVAKILDRYDIDSCTCHYTVFKWPTALIDGMDSFEYTLNADIVREVDTNKELINVMKGGIQSKWNLPGVYHGMIKRDILNRVYEKSGSFFPGPSPDMANAFAVSFYIKRHIKTLIPFVVNGYCKASTGSLTEKKQHVGKLEDQPFLPEDTIETWTAEIPRVWLPNTIWPQSAIRAMMRCERTDLLKYVNFTAIYIKIAAIYPQFGKMCKEYMQNYSSWLNCAITFCSVAFNAAKNRIKDIKKSNAHFEISNISSIGEAIAATGDIIDKNDMLKQFEKAISN